MKIGHITLPTSLDNCKQQSEDAQSAIRAAERDELKTHSRRQKQLYDTADHLDQQGNKSHNKALCRLARAEATKTAYRKCAKVRGKLMESGLLEIPTNPTDNPKTCTDWTRIDCPTEIERLLTIRNQKHFGQMEGTPLTCPPQ